jgi:hypothetical protein
VVDGVCEVVFPRTAVRGGGNPVKNAAKRRIQNWMPAAAHYCPGKIDCVKFTHPRHPVVPTMEGGNAGNAGAVGSQNEVHPKTTANQDGSRSEASMDGGHTRNAGAIPSTTG